MWQGLSAECEKMVKYRGVTETGRKVILDKHNQLRRRIARGEEGRGLGGRGQPPAADMRRLGWSEELAAVAQRWADQCTLGPGHAGRAVRGPERLPGALGPDGGGGGGWAGTYTHTSYLSTCQLNAGLWTGVQMWYDEVDIFDSSLIESFA